MTKYRYIRDHETHTPYGVIAWDVVNNKVVAGFAIESRQKYVCKKNAKAIAEGRLEKAKTMMDIAPTLKDHHGFFDSKLHMLEYVEQRLSTLFENHGKKFHPYVPDYTQTV